MRRAPAKVVWIKDISSSARASVVGAIIRKDDMEMVIDDGTGQVTVLLSEETPLKVTDKVRVIGRVYGNTIEAEVIQDMNDLNTDLYRKSVDIIRKYHEM
ncbi:MAG TPA: hypothetical protein PK718_07800 [Candidatus Methanofastidiosa archaeon]|nr:hypothetical protein [Candidatus Methanofastidiosa archaeon]